MKRLSVFHILIVSLFLTVGCAAIKDKVDSAKVCASDPVCLEEATKQAKHMREVGRAVGDAVPFPAAPMVAGSVFYGVALIFHLVKGGDKKKKEQPQL